MAKNQSTFTRSKDLKGSFIGAKNINKYTANQKSKANRINFYSLNKIIMDKSDKIQELVGKINTLNVKVLIEGEPSVYISALGKDYTKIQIKGYHFEEQDYKDICDFATKLHKKKAESTIKLIIKERDNLTGQLKKLFLT